MFSFQIKNSAFGSRNKLYGAAADSLRGADDGRKQLKFIVVVFVSNAGAAAEKEYSRIRQLSGDQYGKDYGVNGVNGVTGRREAAPARSPAKRPLFA